MPIEEREDFPHVGSRARRFTRFERDLRAWLQTPHGQFAAWHARQVVDAPLERGAVGAEALHHDLR